MASVKICITDGEGSRLFHNMNQAIVKTYSNQITLTHNHQANFEKTYGVKVISAAFGHWSHLEFPSEQAYTMAVLKWL